MAGDPSPPNPLLDLVITDAGRVPPGLAPVNLMFVDRLPVICLLDMGGGPLREPFFDRDVERRLSEQADAVRAVVDVPTFLSYASRGTSATPSGFLFHVSRCGSTLASQMLAALDRNVVISEPEIVNDILLLQDEVLAPEQRLALLEQVVRGLGTMARGATASHLFVKFSSWNVLALERIRAAFPEVPWLFVYRDPVEVMVSVLRSSTGWMRTKHDRGRLFEFMGFSVQDAQGLDDTEYCARVLGRFFGSALATAGPTRALLPYTRMPEGVLEIAAQHFGLELCDADHAAILKVAAYDAKGGAGQRFRPDTHEKRAEAGARVRDAAARWVDPAFKALESEYRQASGTC